VKNTVNVQHLQSYILPKSVLSVETFPPPAQSTTLLPQVNRDCGSTWIKNHVPQKW